MLTLLFSLLAAVLPIDTANTVTITESERWVKYEHSKNFAPGSALDFSQLGLLDAPSGKYGWLKIKDGDFFFEGKSDKPVRFNGINLCYTANYLSHALADSLIDRLVCLGFNSIRIHHHDNYLYDAQNWEKLDYLVARAISKGIYFTTDMFVSRNIKYSDLGFEKEGNMSKNLFKALVGCYEPAFENWCSFSKMFMEHVNQYTGRAYKDEPALNLISLINEDKIRNCKELDNPGLQKAWNEFGGKGKLRKDAEGFYEFEDYLHAQSYKKCSAYLRSLGCKALFTIDNNGHDHREDKGAAQLYDYMDDHFYIDDKRTLTKNGGLPQVCKHINTVYTNGVKTLSYPVKKPTKPMAVSEWNFCGANKYRSQGGLMTGALASVRGYDAMWRFAYSHTDRDVKAENSSQPSNYNVSTDPVMTANQRAMSCLFAREDLTDSAGIVMNKEAGSLTVISDRTCGFFCYDGDMEAGPLKAKISEAPASLWVSSLDESAIPDSKRLLLVHVTDVCGNGARYGNESRTIILSWGKNCLIEKGRANVSLSVSNPRSYVVYELRADGTRAGKIKTSVKNGRLDFEVSTNGPRGGRIYYEIIKTGHPDKN